jgi:hypothetical protein
MSYDVKCEQLAEAFLADVPGRPYSSQELMDLAQVIQNAIEGWFAERAAAPAEE